MSNVIGIPYKYIVFEKDGKFVYLMWDSYTKQIVYGNARSYLYTPIDNAFSILIMRGWTEKERGETTFIDPEGKQQRQIIDAHNRGKSTDD